MFEDHHLSVPNLCQVHIVTVTHFLWSWSGLQSRKIISHDVMLF